MKKLLFTLLLAAGALSITMIYSCKKKDSAEETKPASLDSNNQTFNDDANFYKSENDQLDNDVNADLAYHPSIGQRRSAGGERFQSYNPPCGSTVDTSLLISDKKLIYNFDGTTNCWGRHRSGSITVQLTNGNHWSEAGAVLTFSTSNYTVTRIYDGKSLTISGTKTLTNTNGFNWVTFFLGASTVKYTERALNVQVNFSNGLHAVWNDAHVAEWSFSPLTYVYSVTCNGDTTINSTDHVSAWGTNRFNQPFTTHYTSQIVCNSTCGYSQPLSGQLVHNVNATSLTLTLGVNSDGSTHSGSGCPWGFNVSWLLSNGNNGSANFHYY